METSCTILFLLVNLVGILGQLKCPETTEAVTCHYVPGTCICATSQYYTGGYSMAADDLCKYADPESTIMSIHNLGENAVLNEILRGAIDEKISDAWLGLRFKDGQFMWEDGSAVEYYNWDQADQHGNSSACYKIKADTGMWVEANGCMEELKASCRFAFGKSTTSTVSTLKPTVPTTDCSSSVLAIVLIVCVVVLALIILAGVLFLVRRWFRTSRQKENYRSLAASMVTT